jgi:micrococcal nuclease
MSRYNYPILSYVVTDGDTVKCVIDLGWGLTNRVAVRINGVDCPESRTRRKLEKQAGLVVKAVVVQWLEGKEYLQLHSDNLIGKYAGRCMGNVHWGVSTFRTRDLSIYLLENKLARKYGGGKRKPWGDAELRRIIKRCAWILGV